ncbi:MAG: tRNA uridine-5-carboxymethylaminomethyl(34) synthesis GTPase MnmE [Bacteroidales bacterium]
MMRQQDTICALSTASAEAAIAVVRLSGEDALAVIRQVFVPANPERFADAEAYRVYYGSIMENEDETLDDVLVSVFKAPHSYTGEDMVEISCHGSLYIQQRLLELLCANGARLANPGEFTERAFLNGKMELSQAEAVADVIASDTKVSHQIAIRQMKEGYGGAIKRLREHLLKLVSLMELELDFSEEDVEFADRDELRGLLDDIIERISRLLDSFRYGNVIKHGMPVVIAGKPNVGKSTLLNTLLNEDRAIVSEIPGTTRDSLEDDMVIDGIRFRFIDTAGLHYATDEIEVKGITRTRQKLEKAGMVLIMAEAADSREAIKALCDEVKKSLVNSDAALFLLLNKNDVQAAGTGYNVDMPVFRISAITGQGIENLTKAMVAKVRNMGSDTDVVVSNARHAAALRKALDAAARAGEAMNSGIPGDLVSQDLREVLHHLGSITGEITTDEVLGHIFEHFCIGK